MEATGHGTKWLNSMGDIGGMYSAIDIKKLFLKQNIQPKVYKVPWKKLIVDKKCI